MNSPPRAAAAVAACGRLLKGRCQAGARVSPVAERPASLGGALRPPPSVGDSASSAWGFSQRGGLRAKLILLHMHERVAFLLGEGEAWSSAEGC